MMKREYEESIGEMVDEIILLLRAHAVIENDYPDKSCVGKHVLSGDLTYLRMKLKFKSPHLAAILYVCERLNREAKACDQEVFRLIRTSVPKETCSDKSCPGYGKHLVWDEKGYAICSTPADEEEVKL